MAERTPFVLNLHTNDDDDLTNLQLLDKVSSLVYFSFFPHKHGSVYVSKKGHQEMKFLNVNEL